MDKPEILIVDDDDDVRTQMKWALTQQYEVLLAEDRHQAIQQLQHKAPAVVTLDLGLPPSPGDPKEGFLTLSEMLQIDPLLKVIVITGQNERQNGMEAIAQGAYDFFCKPVNIEDLKVVVAHALQLQRFKREARGLQASGPAESFEGILGSSPQMHAVFSTLRKVSNTDASVLILGESGTGKELVARAIHRTSARKNGPFVAINCGAIPENLLESELFGHEKGAFTDAHVQRLGRVEMAHGGTLFLDEIAELSAPLQVKLLRFLQEHEVERLGGRSVINVDARVVAATNVDLGVAMSEGRFREDLYYRLAVVAIPIPALRDREGDVELLGRAFLQRQASIQGKNLVLTAKALAAMASYGWPGNVRELENRIQRAAIMAENGKITPEDLTLDTLPSDHPGRSLSKAREGLEKQMVESALARNNGNLTRAAIDLEISRSSLYELIEKLGVSRR